MPVVTVLLPVFNGEKYLAEAIESVLVQSFRDLELLVVDDGSTDGSLELAQSYSDKRIRILKNETRLKLSGALNRGIEAAEGRYIARMDHDDVCVRDRIQKQVSFLERRPEIGMCGGWARAFGEHESSGTVFKYPLSVEDVRAGLLFDNAFAHPSMMFRKSTFIEHGFKYNGDYYPAEDYELWTRALEKLKACNIGEVLLKYRLHPESMTMAGKIDMDSQSIRILKPMFARIGMEPNDDELMFHRFISTDRLAPDWSVDSVSRTENWLSSICVANRVSGIHSEASMRRMIDAVWFSVMYRSLNIAPGMLARFLRFKGVSGIPSRGKQAVMIMARIKRSLLHS